MNTKNELKLWLNNNPHQARKKAKIYSLGILHQLLSDTCPDSACFEIKRTKNGKPYADLAIDFSYSHSRQTYLYGISELGPIGVDLESTAKNRDFMTLAKRYFHADEALQMSVLEKSQQGDFFYRLWTRKEAWCKFSGGVLWYYLGRSVLADQVQTEKNKTVHLFDLTEINGYAAAVATAFPVDKFYINIIK